MSKKLAAITILILVVIIVEWVLYLTTVDNSESALVQLVGDMKTDPQLSLIDEVDGEVDIRSDRLAELVGMYPDKAIELFEESDSYYVRSNLIWAMHRQGHHVAFLGLALREINRTPDSRLWMWRRSRWFICDLAPDLAEENGLSFVSHPHEPWQPDRLDAGVREFDPADWYWNNEEQVYMRRDLSSTNSTE